MRSCVYFSLTTSIVTSSVNVVYLACTYGPFALATLTVFCADVSTIS